MPEPILDYYRQFGQGHMEHVHRYIAGATGELPPLLQLEIHPVPPGRCHNRCIYCVGGFTPCPTEARFLTAHTMIAACRDAIKLGAKQIVMSSNSGEPALCPDAISEVIAFLMNGTTVTTGLHTCGRTLAALQDALLLSPEQQCYISVGLDAVDPHAYDAAKRPKSTYQGASTACQCVVESLRELCARKHSRRSGPFISLSVQLTQENSSREALREVLDFAFSTPGINRVRFAAPLPPTELLGGNRGDFVQTVCLSRERLSEVTAFLARDAAECRGAAPNAGLLVQLPEQASAAAVTRHYDRCSNQLLFVTLGPDSWLYPCTTAAATRLELRLARFCKEGDLVGYWRSIERRRRLHFDVHTACDGFDCTRCEHAINSHFNLGGEKKCETSCGAAM
jgi:uncharacterized Fe-S cluster-containing radical SAM superfamily protein